MRFLWRLKLRNLEEKGSTFTVIVLFVIFVLVLICLIMFTSRLSKSVNILKEYAEENCIVQEMEEGYYE